MLGGVCVCVSERVHLSFWSIRWNIRDVTCVGPAMTASEHLGHWWRKGGRRECDAYVHHGREPHEYAYEHDGFVHAQHAKVPQEAPQGLQEQQQASTDIQPRLHRGRPRVKFNFNYFVYIILRVVYCMLDDLVCAWLWRDQWMIRSITAGTVRVPCLHLEQQWHTDHSPHVLPPPRSSYTTYTLSIIVVNHGISHIFEPMNISFSIFESLGNPAKLLFKPTHFIDIMSIFSELFWR